MKMNEDEMITTIPSEEKKQETIDVVLTIDGQAFPIKLYVNKTTTSLLSSMPLSLTFDHLNNNEYFAYLPKRIHSNQTIIKEIQAGDILLYGDDCLVIFYKNYQSNYSYTRIGHISDILTLQELVDKQGGIFQTNISKK